MFVEEMNAMQIKKVDSETVAILVFGACENHGDHLPFGSDFIVPMDLAKRISKRIGNLKNNNQDHLFNWYERLLGHNLKVSNSLHLVGKPVRQYCRIYSVQPDLSHEERELCLEVEIVHRATGRRGF